jgi:hypothetical protein
VTAEVPQIVAVSQTYGSNDTHPKAKLNKLTLAADPEHMAHNFTSGRFDPSPQGCKPLSLQKCGQRPVMVSPVMVGAGYVDPMAGKAFLRILPCGDRCGRP